jgi:hypothetical protein
MRTGMRLDETISLINPLVKAEANISVLEGDILDRDPGLVGRFDVARASNVLNRGYFSAQQIEAAVANLHAYVRERGLLLISRSHSAGRVETDHGSIWRRSEGRFVHLVSFGAGAEVRDHVERYEAPICA